MDPAPAAQVVAIRDLASVAVARVAVRTIGAALGMPQVAVEEVALIASELATNQVKYAREGCVTIGPLFRDDTVGIEVVAQDRGHGIPNLVGGLPERPPPTRSLRIGLESVRRLADEVDVAVRQREGTTIRARRWVPFMKRHPETALLGRPHRGESVSGDHGLTRREGHLVLCALADGLGHGPAARIASTAALSPIREGAIGAPLEELLVAAHTACRRTRGAVMTLARYNVLTREVVCCGIGNVRCAIVGPTGRMSDTTVTPGTLGQRRPLRCKIPTARRALRSSDAVVLLSDGIVARGEVQLGTRLLQHPMVLAAHLLGLADGHDDATVLVLR